MSTNVNRVSVSI